MEKLTEKLAQFVTTREDNLISAENAIYPELAGMPMYEAPLVAVADANDPIFTTEFRKPNVINPNYWSPQQWLEGAQSVISFFLPFTEEIRKSNVSLKDEPYEEGLNQLASAAWLHARIEGQSFLEEVCKYIQQLLAEEGYESVTPAIDPRFTMLAPIVSNWSERHTAYAAGLGTFGLSKGLITEKGMAGRFGSVITTAKLPVTKRPYSSPFEYCTMCGACAKRCPANAIDPEKGVALGKNHMICAPYVNGGKLPPHGPNKITRYGCGKCQVGVPCEFKRP